MNKRRLLKRMGLFLLFMTPLSFPAGFLLSSLAARQVRVLLPPGSSVGRVTWSWPVGITVKGLTIPDPAEKLPFLLKVEKGRFQVPLWVLWVRPIPVNVTLWSPHLQMHSGNIYQVVHGLGLRPQKWLPVPLWEPSEEAGPTISVPFTPLSLKIVNGRVDACEEQIQEGKPVFIAAHINLSVGLSAMFTDPVLKLTASGDFLSEEGKTVGGQYVSVTLVPQKQYMRGFLRLRHERLEDFRKLYEYAPAPILIERGMADAVLDGELVDGKRLKLTARCLVQNLDMTGQVGEVSWAAIMHAVEDEQRRYEWVVQLEGDVDDPRFNPHDRILREVEFLMKEKAATAAGLKIPGPMFFYADTPETPTKKPRSE